MAAISTWSTTAADNNSASPDGFPEGMAPKGVNNSAREVMAQVRAWYEDSEWVNLGYTHTYASATSVTVSGVDVTADYPPGRGVRAVGTTTGTIYGHVASSSFSTNTTITFTWVSGSLQNETLTISVGVVNALAGATALPWFTTKSGELTFNDGGGAVDFRLEGDTDSSLFLSDASEDAIAIGGAVESGYKLSVHGDLYVESSDGAAAAFVSTDAGATAGPIISFFRDSASPADDDVLMRFLIEGRDDAASKIVYGRQEWRITDATAATVTSKYSLVLRDEGTLRTIDIHAYSGNPEGALAGAIGALCVNLNGGAGTTLYVKESGAGTNTGWAGK